MPSPLAVYFWPDSAGSIPNKKNLIVIAVRTLPTTIRFQARKQIRMAIQHVLAEKLSCQYTEVKFISELGQSLKLTQPRQNIGLSISHESGLSLAAINMQGRVGVDLINIKTIPNKSEIETLALEYLGAGVADSLSHLSFEEQNRAFAQAWTEFEARLKCQEKNLTEWIPSNATQLNTLAARSLSLPENYIGSVVFSD